MSETGDVLIAGAGPAGSVAAYRLASVGARVAMLDGLQAGPARIGEILPGAACRLLAVLGLENVLQPEANSVLGRAGGRIFAWGSEVPIREDAINDPFGPGVRLDRLRFDQALRRKAIEAGAGFCRANVVSIERADAGWRCTLTDGARVAARWLIDATGRSARIGRLLGARRHRGSALVGLYATAVPSSNADVDRTVIEALPSGWIYAGRLGGRHFAVGFHTSPREAAVIRRMPQRFDDIIRAAPMLAVMFRSFEFDGKLIARDARSAWIEPLRGAKWISCGDAALSFDPLAGQGLFNAIRTGMAAADEISTNTGEATSYEDELERVSMNYRERRHALYCAEMRWKDHPFWRAHQS
ncbi:NAD(P)/FAD-dependent oxidoreductase [Rhizobium leguminosarum]|uniref:NAD(P)/FAD-dependent oxidoreductase n=1 Tax=Rhizobium leguminosarum TaxID=384 RepID=UPI001C9387E3|nr:NAD(P)/FAD-dependent oxidoreductase [Rhizobium leguminosarum]MBY5337010.1 NAD(P)/FAD-dependent oxidoreductase [Rhizobium leguminosarum]